MTQLAEFPFFPVAFNRAGQPVDPGEIDAIRAAISSGAVSDLIVISHGWNNDLQEAHDLYGAFFGTARQLISSGALTPEADRRFAILGVFWPSKRFAERELIPGGAAGLGGAGTAALRAELEALEGVFDAPEASRTLAALAELLPRLEDSEQACAEFVALARTLVPAAAAEANDEADGAALFLALPPWEVFSRFQQPLGAPEWPGAEPQGAAGLGGVFGGIGAAARQVLNLTTYYQMKHRAGVVGAVGLNPLLRALQALDGGHRQHLIGHSFGARLVTACVAGGVDGESAVLPVASLVLLQAAFSHHGLAERWDGRRDGVFRRVMSEGALQGPCVITHTANDRAVGLAYPLASLLAGQVAAGLGDADDPHGGMGRNGAQHTPEAVQGMLQRVGASYGFQRGRVHNLLADAHIQDHNDISGDAVAYATFQAMGCP
jgi:hypothetical protein